MTRRPKGQRGFPRWSLLTVAILAVALVIAVEHGRTWDAVIVGVLLLPPVGFLIVWLFTAANRERGGTR